MNLPKLADQLLPFLLPLLRQSAQSGGASAQVAQHELSGGLHVGVLADSQAPQFLKMDGSRPLTGNLSVVDGVQIDGVDISVHAGDPAAHHAPVTSGTLISVLGQQVSVAPGAAYQFIGTGGDTTPEWRNVSELAGNGMTAANGVLAVGVANTGATGLSVEADAVRLTSSSNPGAAASVLASDANGYLQLVRIGLGMAPTKPLSVSGDAGISGNVAAGSLSVTGAATVGQDFTVGANVLYVNQAGTRVGINRAPDQQFDLDVAGAIRGQYLIGRHAIQLASAVGVWHYDGPAPYNLDYTGSSASHLGGGFEEVGGVIYRPGKFGKAIQVAESTTNYCPDPSSEGTSAWSAQYNGSGYLSGSQSSDYALYGNRSYRIAATAATWTGNYNAPHYQVGGAVTWAPGDSITVSCYVRGTGTWRIVGEDTEQNLRGAQSVTATDQWQRVSVTCINDTGYTYSSFALAVFSETAGTIYIDGVQIEKKPYATPYCDGSLGAGHSWSGAAHASASARERTYVKYDIDARQSTQWTIMCWRKLDAFPSNTISWSVRWGNAADPSYQLVLAYRNAENVWRWYASIQDAGGTRRDAGVECNAVGGMDWHHLAMTVNVTTGAMVAYLDGVAIGSATLPSTTGWYGNAWDTLSLYTNGAASGLIDELVVLDYVADAKLIRAIYESDAPVFVESSVFHWRSPSASPIWVDEYGLWARSVSGNEILGVYGGDPRRTATYRSWGGINLEDNDVLIGRAAGGYMHWDDSAQTLSVQGTITALAGSISGVLTIGTSGEIRQGTGTLGSDYTGLRIWRDSSIGRIGGYASNTLQWYAGTDGRFYAAGGVVSINQYGYMVATADFSSGGTWPFTFAGVHAVADVTAPTSNYRGSLMFGQPIGVFTDVPRVWHFHYPGTLAANTPTGGGASKEYAITISDDNESWAVWHTGNDSALAKLAGATFTGALRVSGDGGGATSSIGFSNVSNTSANSTGVGTVLMKGSTSRNSAGFIKIYIGTTAYYVPVFSAITG